MKKITSVLTFWMAAALLLSTQYSIAQSYNLLVSKDASTNFTRTIEWSISNEVYPETFDMFTGDVATAEYTITVFKGVADSDWTAQGSIVISNNSPLDATITGISDVVSPDIPVNLDCGVTFPYSLPAGATLVCTYAVDLPDGSNRVNTVTVTTTGDVGGGTGSADIIFEEPTEVIGYDVVTVTENSIGASWGVSGDAQINWSRTFTCNSDEGEHYSTAVILEYNYSDDAFVTVNCYSPVVVKTAETSLVRTYSWAIDKNVDQSALTLSPGQQFLVNYSVYVDAFAVDSDWNVSGDITIHNPAPISAVINAIDDIISPAIIANVDCGVEFPITLGPYASLTCSYQAYLPDASSTANSATATFQNYAYASDGTTTLNGTTSYTGSASVDFAVATISEIDECVDIDDTMTGPLGTVCSYPATFSYSKWIGPYAESGEFNVINTASILTHDTGTTLSDDANIIVNVTSCILGSGYWKTHSKYGPAPYDDTWSQIAGVDEDFPFFLSGQTYYDVLWTIPRGKAYYILAKEYIAAQLNLINGAPYNAQVAEAIIDAQVLFGTYTPNQINKKSPLRDYFLSLALLLNDYNNGLIISSSCSQAEPLETISDVKPSSSKNNLLENDLEPVNNMVIKAYPNPFENVVTISVVSPTESNIELTLYDIAGRQLINPVSNYLQEGQTVEFNFDAGQLNSSFIFYKLTTDKESKIGKLIRMN